MKKNKSHKKISKKSVKKSAHSGKKQKKAQKAKPTKKAKKVLVPGIRQKKKKPVSAIGSTRGDADAKPLKKGDKQEQGTARLVAKGKERGYVTYDEILKEFPTVEEDIMFLDELYEKLNTAGVDILEGGGLLENPNLDEIAGKKYAYGKNDSSYDSIQMYLKEIGQYQLI